MCDLSLKTIGCDRSLIIPALLALSVLLLCPPLFASDLDKAQQQHEFLWNEAVHRYACDIREQPNTRLPVLVGIQLPQEPFSVQGEAAIGVPADIAPHFRQFSFLELSGSGLRGIRSIAHRTPTTVTMLPISEKTDTLIRIPGSAFSGWSEAGEQVLVLMGNGARINSVRLLSLEGIPREFQASLLHDVGADAPLVKCDIHIATDRRLSLEGVTELKPENYFRLYLTPGSEPENFEAQFRQLGFLPGRQMLKLADELETRHGSFTPPLLQESTTKAGYAELSLFEKISTNRFRGVDPNLSFVQSLNIWPSFMGAEVKGHRNERGTPAVEHFDAAAELAAAYVADEIADSGRTANWWEVKNESDVPYEWVYHHDNSVDSWKLLADFHNKVADALKRVDASIQVGGPASAWPRMEMGAKPFGVWDRHKQFIDQTRDSLDFYSHHFYEMGDALTNKARSENYEGWMQGRLENVLDMLQAHMRESGNVKPILVTEYGTLQGGRSEYDYWLRVSNYSSFMMRFMQRPAEIDMSVAFLLGHMAWEPDSGLALIDRSRQGDYSLTKNRYFLDQWEGVQGTYLPARSSIAGVLPLAWLDADTIYLAVNNQSAVRAEINPFNAIGGGSARIESITFRHPTYDHGKFLYNEGTLKHGDSYVLPINETVLFVCKLAQPVALRGELLRRSYYSMQTGVLPAKDGRLTLTIAIPGNGKKPDDAVLRLGVFVKDADVAKLQVRLNGQLLRAPVRSLPQSGTFFEYLEWEGLSGDLRERNVITVRGLPPGCGISHAKLTLDFNSNL